MLPHLGHNLSSDGACDAMLLDFVDRGTTTGPDATGCVGEVWLPPFELPHRSHR